MSAKKPLKDEDTAHQAVSARATILPMPQATSAPAASADTLQDEDPMSNLTVDDQKHWNDVIKRNIKTHVRFFVERRTQAGVEAAVRDCPLANLSADAAGTVIFFMM